MIDPGSVNSEVYPQKASGTTTPNTGPEPEIRGPNYFKFGEEKVFHRPGEILTSYFEANQLRLVCATHQYLNSTTQTHETRLHQFTSCETEEAASQSRVNIEITVWSEKVFRVRFSSEALPASEPAFPPTHSAMLVGQPEANLQLTFAEDAQQFLITTTALEIRVDKAEFRASASNLAGQLFWSQRRSDIFTSDIFDMSVAQEGRDRAACFEAFTLGPQEEIFGLGERFDHVGRRGHSVDFWNKDVIGTNNPRSYINVPFLFSTSGYGLFLNSSCRTEWEVGTLEAATLGFAIEDRTMDYFVIYGPTPAEILKNYCGLTGFAPLPPVWSFGLWMSRNSYPSWQIVREVARELRAREIPADVLHLDTAWFSEDWNCDLRFAPDRFADPAENMAALKDQGFRVSLWQYNFVPPRLDNPNYREGLEKGYFALGKDGQPFSYPAGTAGSWVDDLVIDFSNPAAVEWYAGQIKELIKLGAASIKTDFGEGIPEDAIYKNIDGRRFHNLYSLVYNSVIADAIEEVSGEHIVWARSGTAGSQRYPLHWSGDSFCNWNELAGTVRSALSVGLSGLPYIAHDIGGFIGRPTPELYVRWAQFGLFSSHSRCHGAGNDNSREPWSFGEEANWVFKKYAQLRYRLLPYILAAATQAGQTGLPVVRALVFQYPDDPNVWRLDDQYMFGEALLVAPVLEPLSQRSDRRLYLPAGSWFDYWTKEIIHSSGGWISRHLDQALDIMPIYVKTGSVIPYATPRQFTNNRIGPIQTLEVYTTSQTELEYRYDDGITSIVLKGQPGNWSLSTQSRERPEVIEFGETSSQ